MRRLFVSLNIPLNIRSKIYSIKDEILNNQFLSNKWESIDKIHCTLKFIGDIQESKVEQVCEKIEFVKNYVPIECELNKFGMFYRNSLPAILYCSFTADNSLTEIVSKLNLTLSDINIAIEKKAFKPHLTILRLKGNEDKNILNKFIEFKVEKTNFVCPEISLYESKLLVLGSVYKEIKKYNLKSMEDL